MVLYYGLRFATPLAGTTSALCAQQNEQINQSAWITYIHNFIEMFIP
jgi:hypothetical protein